MISMSYFKDTTGREFAMRSKGTFQEICISIYKEMQKGNVFIKMESVNPNNDYKKDLTGLVVKAIKPKGRMH